MPLWGPWGPWYVRGPEGPGTLWGPESQDPAGSRGHINLLRPLTGAPSKKNHSGPPVKGVGPKGPQRPQLKLVKGVVLQGPLLEPFP